MSESIQKFISTIREVSEYLPRFSSDDIISDHIGWWFGYGNSGHDYRFGHAFSYDSRVNNVFLRDLLADSSSICTPLMYLVAIPQNSAYERKIVKAINGANMCMPDLISESVLSGNRHISMSSFNNYFYSSDKKGFLTASLSTKKFPSLNINLKNILSLRFYIIFDDVELSILKHLKNKNLEGNIVALSCSMHELRGSGSFGCGTIANYLKNEMGLDQSIRINGDDINDSVKLTKVMSKLISEHGYTDEDWYANIERIEKYGGCRISFQFNNKSKDATKFLMNEFEKNGVVPLRLKWSRGHVDTIVGGIVMCPDENKIKFKNKLTLFGIKSMHDTYDLNGLKGLMLKHEKIQ